MVWRAARTSLTEWGCKLYSLGSYCCSNINMSTINPTSLNGVYSVPEKPVPWRAPILSATSSLSVLMVEQEYTCGKNVSRILTKYRVFRGDLEFFQ